MNAAAQADLRARLLGDAGVAALTTAIAWGERPNRDSLPSVTLTLIVPGRAYAHDGPIGLAGAQVQIDCWGGTHLQAAQLRDAVTEALEPTGVTTGDTLFEAAFLTADHDVEPEDLEGGIRLWRRILQFDVWHAPAS